MPAADARAGGDLYDVVAIGDRVRLIIGDVLGKGHAAADRAAGVLDTFRALAGHEATLQGVAIRLDAFLAGRGDSEQFVTALLAEISGPGGAVTAELVSCGHPAPLVVTVSSATFVSGLVPAPPLSLMRLADGWCGSTVVSLAAGERLLCYTDGVSEARDASGKFYPLADRAVALHDADSGQFIDRLAEDLRDFSGGSLADDAAVLLIQAGPRAVSEVPEGPGAGQCEKLPR